MVVSLPLKQQRKSLQVTDCNEALVIMTCSTISVTLFLDTFVHMFLNDICFYKPTDGCFDQAVMYLGLQSSASWLFVSHHQLHSHPGSWLQPPTSYFPVTFVAVSCNFPSLHGSLWFLFSVVHKITPSYAVVSFVSLKGLIKYIEVTCDANLG